MTEDTICGLIILALLTAGCIVSYHTGRADAGRDRK